MSATRSGFTVSMEMEPPEFREYVVAVLNATTEWDLAELMVFLVQHGWTPPPDVIVTGLDHG
jgi:spore coat protein CotF